MKIISFIKSHYFLIFLLAVANLLIAFFLIKTPLALNGDAPSYLGAMNVLQGKDFDRAAYGADTGILVKMRILTTPLMLYGSIFAGKLVGGEYNGMFLINIVFYFLIIFVFYNLVEAVYADRLTAFLATILFFANYCLYNYGTTFRTDLGGWFFFLLACLWAVKYYKEPSKEKYFYWAIVSSSVGVLFKEYGALGMIILGILIFFLPAGFKEKFGKILKAAVLFLIIPGLYYWFIYCRFNFSYLDLYKFALTKTIYNPVSPGMDWSAVLLVKVLAWLYSVGWLIFLWGVYQEYKNFDKTRAKILLAILPASLSFLAWPSLTQRIAFIFVPWLAMVSGFGLSKIKAKYLVVLILLAYVVFNYLTRPWLMQWINI